MKKLFSIILIFALSLTYFISCADKNEDEEYSSKFDYNPYDNVFKDPVPTDKEYSVTDKIFYFEEIMVRDGDGNKLVTAENALRKLYIHVDVYFSAEDTVRFTDQLHSVFSMSETKGEREGNILTVKHTNSDGYTYDVRIEIHENKIVVIHKGHTYNTPGAYSTITFVE